LKQAAQKQVDEVGDGTTVAMILAQAIIQEAASLIASGTHPMSLRLDLEKTTKKLCKQLETLAVPVSSLQALAQVARIAAEDEELGDLIATLLHKIGKDGVVTVEQSKSRETTSEHQIGMQLDRGYANEWFVTNPERMEAVASNAYVLVTDKPITTFSDITKFLLDFVKVSKNIVIISPEISGDALPSLIQNKMEGKVNSLCIQAPSFGQDQKNILQDIAVITGAHFIGVDTGMTFDDLTIEDLGMAESVVSTKNETIISGGKGEKKDVEKRVKALKSQIAKEDQEFDKERMRSRLGKLTNGVAVIRVGGQTEVEMKERRERALDAVASTKSAMETGIVPGGEIIYLQLQEALLNKDRSDTMGEMILYKALYKPFKKLIDNADLSEIDVRIALLGKPYNWGVDVRDGIVKDFIKEGIVDPMAVPLHALQNAVSVAVQIITTSTVITPMTRDDEKDKKMPTV
jgi:chaperonin GroEL